MTQRELADRVGVGVPHISKVEAGRENASDELIRNLARVFELDPDELLIVARRVPDDVMERMAADPAQAVAFLRSWPAGAARDARSRRRGR